MSLLYRVEDEIAIEMSREAWEVVRRLVSDALLKELFPNNREGIPFRELSCFADAIRSHLQHLEAEKPAIPERYCSGCHPYGWPNGPMPHAPGCSAVAQTNLDLI